MISLGRLGAGLGRILLGLWNRELDYIGISKAGQEVLR
jgi:hypothetical protein